MKPAIRFSSLTLRRPTKIIHLPKLVFIAGFAFGTATAQEADTYTQQASLIKAPEAVLKLGTDLFGDQINLYTGSVEFHHTDVSLRGNSALGMSIGRRVSIGSRVMNGYSFGRWALDIPHIHGIYSARDGWVTKNGGTNRCSNFSAPPMTMGGAESYWNTPEYWSGAFLSLPSGEEKRMLLRASNFTTAPGTPTRYPVVTNDHWTFECLPALANANAGAAGEGFVALSPDGTRYTFDWLAIFPASIVHKSTQEPRGPQAGIANSDLSPSAIRGGAIYAYLYRNDVWLMPTLITDRFGNTVRYTYDVARPRNLVRIESNDGRVLTIIYGASGDENLIKTVSDGTRTWNYSYSGDGARRDLDTVTLPDNSAWKLGGLAPLFRDVIVSSDDKCGNFSDVTSAPVLTGSLQQPSGASAAYTLEPIQHGRTDVPRTCSFNYPAYQIPIKFNTYSLTNRTISGPGTADMTWTYDYVSHGAFRPCSAYCDLGKTVMQHDPAGNVTRYSYGNRFEVNEGKLFQVDYGWDGASALRTVTNRYRAATDAPYPEVYGTTEKAMGDAGTNIKNMPLDQRVTIQQGVNFTWQADAFDAFMRPTQVTRSSSLGASRTEVTSFFDHSTKWILGQVQSVTEASTGKTSVANGYNAESANLETTTTFGKLQSTLAYYADGSLLSRIDGRGLLTAYSDYMRGIPRKVTYADGTSQRVVVSNIGAITAMTNAAGATTSYSYDAMGRLASESYPAGDSVAWNPTLIEYAFVGWPEYDLGAGHWRQVVVTGNAYQRIFFDALWRPVYTETWDATDVAGTMRVVKHQYDFDSRLTFQSYPKRSVPELAQGEHHEYDAVGRPTVTSADSELGPLYSSFSYRNRFTTVQSNARGLETTFSYQAFDEPADTAVVNVSAPEGVSVVIARDIFGKPTSITRSGGGKSATRSYVYDAYQRLCKTIEPETGATVQDYDAANNTAWRASGLALPSTSACDTDSVPAAKRITFDYDRQKPRSIAITVLTVSGISTIVKATLSSAARRPTSFPISQALQSPL